MLKVGLTGSIAVGKSYVAQVFAECGAKVLDADQTARDVVAPGTPGLAAIVAEFGAGILLPDGSLNRARLGGIVFADAAKRSVLNAITHPLVFAAQDEQLKLWEREQPDGVAIVDAALMIESGGYKRFEKLIVAHCRPEIQLERLMRRNSLTAEAATQRIAAQMPQDEKKRYADYLIDTSEGFADTARQVRELYAVLREPMRVAGVKP